MEACPDQEAGDRQGLGGTTTPIGLELEEKDVAHWAGRGERKLGV